MKKKQNKINIRSICKKLNMTPLEFRAYIDDLANESIRKTIQGLKKTLENYE